MIAHDAIDIVLRRVRDPDGTAHSRDFVRAELSVCQNLGNLSFAWVTEDIDFLVKPYHVIYAPLSDLAPRAGRVVSVRSQTGAIPFTDWLLFTYSVPTWLRRVGTQIEHWSYIGRDALMLWPALRRSETVTLTCASLFPAIGGEGNTLDIPDQYVPHVLDLCELHLLTRQRASDDVWNAAAGKALEREDQI